MLGHIRTFFQTCRNGDGYLYDSAQKEFSGHRVVDFLVGQSLALWPMICGVNYFTPDRTAGVGFTKLFCISSNFYPLEMVRALSVLCHLMSLRRDEILRMQCGCIRWQQPEENNVNLSRLIDVPVSKTYAEYSKAS